MEENQAEQTSDKPHAIEISREIIAQAKTGSVPGITRAQEQEVTQPPALSASQQVAGVGAAAGWIARVRNVLANNRKLSEAEREIFAHRCQLATEVAHMVDEQKARELVAQLEYQAAHMVSQMNSKLLEEARQHMKQAEDDLEKDIERIDSRSSLPQAIKDEMLASAIRKYNMATETDDQLLREALDRVKNFRRA